MTRDLNKLFGLDSEWLAVSNLAWKESDVEAYEKAAMAHAEKTGELLLLDGASIPLENVIGVSISKDDAGNVCAMVHLNTGRFINVASASAVQLAEFASMWSGLAVATWIAEARLKQPPAPSV